MTDVQVVKARKKPILAENSEPVSVAGNIGQAADQPLAQLQADLNATAAAQNLRDQSEQLNAVTSPQTTPPQAVAQRAETAGPQNQTGMPEPLKTGLESMSGMDLSDVQVNYNSSKPAQLNAHAYAQGNNIEVAPRQEQHLAHEGWHVVQQKQGRVQPTSSAHGVAINDDVSLEREADVLGHKALSIGSAALSDAQSSASPGSTPTQLAVGSGAILQRKLIITDGDDGDDGGPGREFSGEGDFDEFKEFAEGLVGGSGYEGKFNKHVWDMVSEEGTDIYNLNKSIVDDGTISMSREALMERLMSAVLSSELVRSIDIGAPDFDKAKDVTFGEEGGKGALGYAQKMTAELNLEEISEVIVSTGPLPADVGGFTKLNVADKDEDKSRRPGLSIRNYSNVYKNGDKLRIQDVRSRGLMKQFSLALQLEAAKRPLNLTVETNDPPVVENLENNYNRLVEFFKKNEAFGAVKTLVFGYANAFPDVDESKTETTSGWVGKLYSLSDTGEPDFAVFDSDLKSSYHVEILAENIKRLLQSPEGKNIANILVGGSAGSLVPQRTEDSDVNEENLKANAIYAPDDILRPDGFFIPNALAGFGEDEGIDGSMHTSVVSALTETPKMLEELSNFGVKTVDMEFAYLAKELGESSPPEEGRDLAEVNLGVALLVTDFPRFASNAELAVKDPEQKKHAKEVFHQAVLRYVALVEAGLEGDGALGKSVTASEEEAREKIGNQLQSLTDFIGEYPVGNEVGDSVAEVGKTIETAFSIPRVRAKVRSEFGGFMLALSGAIEVASKPVVLDDEEVVGPNPKLEDLQALRAIAIQLGSDLQELRWL